FTMKRLLLALVVAAPSLALAEPPAPALDVGKTFDQHWFVGLSAGVAWTSVDHPDAYGSFAAPSISLNGGVQFSPHWAAGVSIDSVEKYMRRSTGSGRFAAAAAGADCLTCTSASPGGGIDGVTTTLTTIGPRLDFTPFGENGPYAAASIGAAYIQGAATTATTGF